MLCYLLSRSHQNLSLTNAAVEHHPQQQHDSPQSALLTEYMQLHHHLHQATSQQQLQFSVKAVNVNKISSLHAERIQNGAKRSTGTALLIQLQASGQINTFRRSCLYI
jgi:hypothetical protein